MRYLLLAALALACCGLACCGPKPTTLEDFPTRPITLPGGQVIRVETMSQTFELLRGMMFRKFLAPDRGMLFVYPKADRHEFWMYQTLIPLDIVWLDSNGNIVEVAENAEPCKTQASKCPRYGGTQISTFVLEIKGGMARKYGLQLGQRIRL